jgi:hypothetical protein
MLVTIRGWERGKGRVEVDWVGSGLYIQVFFHLSEGRFGLVEEVEDDACAELSLVFIVIHFEYLDGEVSRTFLLSLEFA